MRQRELIKRPQTLVQLPQVVQVHICMPFTLVAHSDQFWLAFGCPSFFDIL